MPIVPIHGVNPPASATSEHRSTLDYFKSEFNDQTQYERYFPRLEEASSAQGRGRARQIMAQFASTDEITILLGIKENTISRYYNPAACRAGLGMNCHLITWSPLTPSKNIAGDYPETLEGSAGGVPASGDFFDVFGMFHELGHCYQSLTNPLWYEDMVSNSEAHPWCTWLIEQCNIHQNEHTYTQAEWGRYRLLYNSDPGLRSWWAEKGAQVVAQMLGNAAATGETYFPGYQQQNFSTYGSAPSSFDRWWSYAQTCLSGGASSATSLRPRSSSTDSQSQEHTHRASIDL